MAYDYAITIAGTALDSIRSGLEGRFIKYTSGQRRGSNLVIPHKHGELFVPDKYFSTSDVLLELFLPSDSPGAGAEALSEVAILLADQDLVTIAQTDPHRGDIQARVEMVTDPVPTQNEFVYMFGLALPSGFWEDVSATTITSGTPPSVTTGGDRPIDDMILDFAGTGYLEHTDPLGQVARIEIIAGGSGSTPYTVDVGAGTVVDSLGAHQDRWLEVTQEYWMKWQPGAAQSFTGTVAVSGSYRNKWS